VVHPAWTLDDGGMSPTRRADMFVDLGKDGSGGLAAVAGRVAFTDQYVAQAPSLDATGDDPGQGPISLREVPVHMVEEYARHNGHADLLRERLGGRVGQ
jgi:hypothetical protein